METSLQLALPANSGGEIKLVTEKELCAILGIGITTAWSMRRAGKLGYYRVGRRVLYEVPKHVNEFLEAVEQKKSERGHVNGKSRRA